MQSQPEEVMPGNLVFTLTARLLCGGPRPLPDSSDDRAGGGCQPGLNLRYCLELQAGRPTSHIF